MMGDPPAAPPSPFPTTRRRIKAPRLPWRESWIVRAAALASLILLIGYVGSASFAITSIDAIAKLAHDDEIEQSLAAHLTTIKHSHDLEQKLIADRLRPFAERWLTEQGGRAANAEHLTQWLTAAKLADLTKPRDIILSPAPHGKPALPVWLDRDRLQLAGMIAEFPKGPDYEAFKAGENILQRYQLVGAKLDDEIRPNLIRAMAIILVASFILLVSLFIIYARRFKAVLNEITEGFAFWSEDDPAFRFTAFYRGELGLITGQFNAMADEVEANRQRSLYLEKIASWQIIARKLAHEIKNPLTPIQMMVSQLKRRYKGGDDDFGKLLNDAQHIITEEVTGLRRMVDNFSNFARLPEPELREADLLKLGHHVIELQRNAFLQHRLRLESTLTSAPALADVDLLRQVLINLIKNAAEACGDEPADIVLGVNRVTDPVTGGSEYHLTVSDTGPGIAPELTQRIFEAYFTTKHTGPNPGMGLGLAVCQKIVLDHGGKMTVKSRPLATVFTISLPQRKKDP